MRLIKNGFGMPARGPCESVCIDRAMEGRRPLCCNVSRADRMHSFHVRSCKGHSHRVCSLEGSTRIVGISLVPPLFQNEPSHSSPANTGWKVDFYRLDSFLFRLDVAQREYIYIYIYKCWPQSYSVFVS